MRDFHTRLRQLRLENRLTQKQLAERVGVTSAAISAYEVEDRLPTYDVLCKFARIFKVSTDYLLGMEKKRQLDLDGLSDKNIELLNRFADALRESNNNSQS